MNIIIIVSLLLTCNIAMYSSQDDFCRKSTNISSMSSCERLQPSATDFAMIEDHNPVDLLSEQVTKLKKQQEQIEQEVLALNKKVLDQNEQIISLQKEKRAYRVMTCIGVNFPLVVTLIYFLRRKDK